MYLPLPGKESTLEMIDTVKPTSIPSVLLCCTKRLSIDPLSSEIKTQRDPINLHGVLTVDQALL